MSTTDSFHPPQRLLMGPGPSLVDQRVLEAMARPTIGHLDPAFVGLMDDIKARLRRLFRTQNELTLPISGPASVGQETCVVNLVEPGDRVVVCINGVFGQRLAEMAKRAGAEVITVDGEWGRAVDVDALAGTLRDLQDVKLVAFVHAETSTGALSDAQAIAAAAREHGCLVLADTVTSLGGCPVEIDEWGIDAAYSGTQKCLSAPPGLSPITFSERAQAALADRRTRVQSWFMDLSLLTSYWSEGTAARAYHHTAPINALYGLHETLVMIEEEGLEGMWARHRRCHEALVAGLDALGMTLPVPAGERLPQLNSVSVPEGVDEADVRRRLLLEHGIEIGAGLGPLAGRVWRIGLMGTSCTLDNVYRCLDALASVLSDTGYRASPGAAVEAARATGS